VSTRETCFEVLCSHRCDCNAQSAMLPRGIAALDLAAACVASWMACADCSEQMCSCQRLMLAGCCGCDTCALWLCDGAPDEWQVCRPKPRCSLNDDMPPGNKSCHQQWADSRSKQQKDPQIQVPTAAGPVTRAPMWADPVAHPAASCTAPGYRRCWQPPQQAAGSRPRAATSAVAGAAVGASAAAAAARGRWVP
jgi:hypothetical protein